MKDNCDGERLQEEVRIAVGEAEEKFTKVKKRHKVLCK